jgi:hypothetical protein
MARNFFEEIQQAIKDQLKTTPGLVANLHGTVGESTTVAAKGAITQQWYALSAVLGKLPTLREFVDAYTFQRLPATELTAVGGRTQYPASGAIPQGHAVAFFASATLATAIASPITVSAPGHQIALYINDVLVASGAGTLNARLTLSAGQSFVTVLLYGGTGAATIDVDPGLALDRGEPTPPAPAVGGTPLVSFLKAANGSYRVDLDWRNDAFASAWSLYRAPFTTAGVPASLTAQNSATEFVARFADPASVAGLVVGAPIVLGTTFIGIVHTITVVRDGSSVVLGADVSITLLPDVSDDPADYTGQSLQFSSETYVSLGRVSYGGTPTVRFTDTGVLEGAWYSYRVTAFGFLTGTAESDYSSPVVVHIVDTTIPGSITTTLATDLTIVDGQVTLAFTAPSDVDYRGLKIFDPSDVEIAQEHGLPSQKDFAVFRVPATAGTYQFRTYDWAGNVQASGAGVSWSYDGDQHLTRKVDDPAEATSPVLASIDLVFTDATDKLTPTVIGGPFTRSVKVELATVADFSAIVQTYEATLLPDDTWTADYTIVSADRNKTWYVRATPYNGPIVSTHVSGTAGQKLQDTAFIPSDVSSASGAISLSVDASGNVTLFIGNDGTALSYGYTLSTSGFDFDRSHQTTANFSGSSSVSVSAGTITSGQKKFAVVWFYTGTGGTGTFGQPATDTITLDEARAPYLDFILQIPDGTDPTLVDFQIGVVDPAGLGGTFKIWTNKSGTASADPTATADGTYSISSTPFTVTGTQSSLLDNVKTNAQADKIVYFEFVNSGGQSTGRRSVKVVSKVLDIDTDGHLGNAVIDAQNFASGFRPIQILGALPGSPVTGDLVLLTTDGKLYRWDGTAWTVVISTTDGLVDTAQIKAGAIDATKFTSSIRPVKIIANTSVAGSSAGDVAYSLADGKLYRWDGAAWTSAVPAIDITGQVATAQIADGAINTAKFASGIRPVRIVANTSAAGQVAGDIVFSTADNKLYRWTGSAWTAAVPAVDVTGQITSGQITDGAVIAGKIAALAVSASELANGAVTSGKIAASAVIADKIAARSVSLEKLFVGSYDNLIIDPGFEQATVLSGVDGWSTNGPGNGGGTRSIVTTNVRSGLQAVQFNPSGQTLNTGLAANGALTTPSKHVAATVGDQFYFELWGRKVSTGTPCNLQAVIRFHSATGTTLLSTVSSPVVPTTTYEKVSVTATAPANTAYVAFQVNFVFVSGATELVVIDDAYARRMLTGEIVVDGAITAQKIAANTITASQIAAHTITATQLAAHTITANEIAADTITAAEIAAGAITANELAANSVIAGKIMAGAISTTELAANAVTAAKIAAHTITANEIAADTITANEIAAATITAAEMAANSITASQLQANSVIAGKIAAAAVTASTIAAGAIILRRTPKVLYARKSSSMSSDGNIVALLSALGYTVTTDFAATLATARGYDAVVVDCTAWSGGEHNAFIQALWADGQRVFVTGNDSSTDLWYITSSVGASPLGTMTPLFTNHPVNSNWAPIADSDAGTRPTGIVAYAKAVATFVENTSAYSVIEVPHQSGGVVLHCQLAISGIAGADTSKFLESAFRYLTEASFRPTVGLINGTYIDTNSITTPHLQTNSVSADKIQANAITAGKLLIVDTTNLISNPVFETGNAQDWSKPASGSIIAASDGSVPGASKPDVAFVAKQPGNSTFNDWAVSDNLAGGNIRWFPVIPGEKYYASIWSARDASYNGTIQIGMMFQTQTGTNSWVQSAFTLTTTWQEYGVAVTVPAGVTKGVFWFSVRNDATAGNAFFTLARLRKQSGATLIEDGAIITDKIAANAVTATQIAAASITATKLYLTDFSTLVEDGSIEGGALNWELQTGWTVVTDGSIAHSGTKFLRHIQAGTSAAKNSMVVPCKPGDLFSVEGWIRGEVGVTGMVGLVRLAWLDASKAESFGYAEGNHITTADNSWYRSFGTGVAPAGSVYVRADFVVIATNTGSVYCDDLAMRRMTAGELIVDGTITGIKIAANQVTATHLNISTLSSITANAGIITDATLRNSASTRYLNLNADGTGSFPDFLHHERVSLLSDGTALFKGKIQLGGDTPASGEWTLGQIDFLTAAGVAWGKLEAYASDATGGAAYNQLMFTMGGDFILRMNSPGTAFPTGMIYADAPMTFFSLTTFDANLDIFGDITHHGINCTFVKVTAPSLVVSDWTVKEDTSNVDKIFQWLYLGTNRMHLTNGGSLWVDQGYNTFSRNLRSPTLI